MIYSWLMVIYNGEWDHPFDWDIWRNIMGYHQPYEDISWVCTKGYKGVSNFTNHPCIVFSIRNHPAMEIPPFREAHFGNPSKMTVNSASECMLIARTMFWDRLIMSTNDGLTFLKSVTCDFEFYPLIIWDSYWKLPFIVDLSIKNGDFP